MSPKNIPQPSHDQGALFTTEVTAITVGAADPDTQKHAYIVHLEPVEEGVYETKILPAVTESKPPTPQDVAFMRGVHESVVTHHRRQAQVGKHSPMTRDGNYSSIRSGDFLPGFGPVTHRNIAEAEKHAQELEKQRFNR